MENPGMRIVVIPPAHKKQAILTIQCMYNAFLSACVSIVHSDMVANTAQSVDPIRSADGVSYRILSGTKNSPMIIRQIVITMLLMTAHGGQDVFLIGISFFCIFL